jgi:uncharacterized protein (TIGR03435 family)
MTLSLISSKIRWLSLQATTVVVLAGTKFFNTSMAALAYVLCSPGSPVDDATGLSGNYDFQLARDAAIPAGPNEPGSPARFRIEDLGLGLRGTSREMPLMVIDHYEKPSTN